MRHALRGIEDLLPDRLAGARSTLGDVLLHERDVGSDRALEEVQRVALQDQPDGGRQYVERSQDGLSKHDVAGPHAAAGSTVSASHTSAMRIVDAIG